jgi:hypothetical protein
MHRDRCCPVGLYPLCVSLLRCIAELLHVYLASRVAKAGTPLTMLRDVTTLFWSSGALHTQAMCVCPVF